VLKFYSNLGKSFGTDPLKKLVKHINPKIKTTLEILAVLNVDGSIFLLILKKLLSNFFVECAQLRYKNIEALSIVFSWCWRLL